MSRNRGASVLELMLAVAIISAVVLVLSRLFTTSTRMLTETTAKTSGDINLRFALEKIETTLLNANLLNVATSSDVMFTADCITDPGYQRNADFDGDGIANGIDPDDDSDATLIQPPTAQWRKGYDLKDDDDDNDTQPDLLWRIYLVPDKKTIYRDYARNGEAWGTHVETILSNVVSTTIFTFQGSKNDLLSQGGANLDSNNDGIISDGEIDALINGGNGNGMLDSNAERNRIVTVGISVNQDVNKDGKTDSQLSTEVIPPALYLKRRP